MVFLKSKDDKTVIKLMGSIIQNLGIVLESGDIIEDVNKEMNN